MAALTLVARSQRCHGVSAALAEKLRTSNSPTGRIPRDPGDTYDLEMVASLRSRISAHVFELNDNALGSRRYPPFAQSSTPQYSKNYRLTQMGPSRIALLCECGKRTSGDRPVADRKALASTRLTVFLSTGATCMWTFITFRSCGPYRAYWPRRASETSLNRPPFFYFRRG